MVEQSEDFKTWTFKLRPDVKFQDGTPFNAQAVAWNYARQKDPKNHCRCAFYISNINSVEAKDDLTVVFHLRNPSVNLPATLTIPSSNNVVQSPTAIQAKGDDYNRNPVGTGPFVLKSWTAGDRMVLERNPNYWNKGHPYLDRIVLRPLPDSQSRFASLLSGETDVVWADEYEADNIMRARKNPALKVYDYVGSGATVYAFNTKVAPFDDVRVRQALVMALDRKKMSQALTNGLARPATNPYGDGSWVKCKDDGALPYDPAKARELIKAYGKPVDFKMLVTATPRGRAVGQVLAADVEAGRRQHGDRAGRPGDHRAARLPAQVPAHSMAHRRSRRSRPADVRQLPHRQPGGARQLLQSRARQAAGTCARHADPAKRTEDYCAISRLINKEAIWFWTFQNTYYAIAKANVKGIPKLYSGVINLLNAWLE